jgi:predicted ArsR family transcriptional regulator
MELRSPNEPVGSSQDSRPVEPPPFRPVFSGWTFLTNHAHVLVLLSSHPSIVLREVAARIGITERAVQGIIHELEQDGFIVRQKVGRQNHYQVNGDKNLRHPIVEHCLVQEVLDLIARRKTSQI